MESERAIFNTDDKEKQICRVKVQYSTLMIKRNQLWKDIPVTSGENNILSKYSFRYFSFTPIQFYIAIYFTKNLISEQI